LNLAAAFPPAETGGEATRILLSHNPDTKEFLKFHPWDLLLCGHTHGGQVVLPGLGAPWTPVRDKRFIAGMYSWDNRWIHITRGVGNVHGLRFNCPPEVSLVTLL
jgi:predicted MPP superfamily phosphohydrolase